MENLAVNAMCPFLSTDSKETIRNKREHTIKQVLHAKQTQAKDTFATVAGVAGSIGAAAAVSKSKTAQNFISKYISKGLNGTKNNKVIKDTVEELSPYIKKCANKFKALPTPAKVVLGIGLVLTTAASILIRTKGIYDAGKIDQEYIDKAKLQNALK